MLLIGQDTLTAIAGSIAEGFYGVPKEMRSACLRRLPKDLKEMLKRAETYIKRGY